MIVMTMISFTLPHKSCLGLGLHGKQPQIIPTKAHLGGRIRPAQVTPSSLSHLNYRKSTNNLRPRSPKWSLTPKCTAYLSSNVQKRCLRPSSSWTHKSFVVHSYLHISIVQPSELTVAAQIFSAMDGSCVFFSF